MRKLSPTERLWLVADMLRPPFANQMVLEGVGTLDEGKWRAAVEAASARNPGSRLVARGWLGFTRWVDSGVTPRVRSVDGSRWSGTGPDGAPFLLDPLPAKEGPTCEVVLVQGSKPRVIFRTLHAVMDARGTIEWAEDVFAALRGQPIQGSRADLRDISFARRIRRDTRGEWPKNCIAPTGRIRGNEEGVTWRRVSLRGRYSNLLPRIAVIVAKEARRYGWGPVRFAVPVDMRPHGSAPRCTSNLTGMAVLEVAEGDTPETLRSQLRAALDEKSFAVFTRHAELILHIPLKKMLQWGHEVLDKARHTARFEQTAVLSNLGLLKLDSMTTDDFKPECGFFIPPGSDGLPLFMALAGTREGVELCVSVPRSMATDGRLEECLDAIEHGLVGPQETDAADKRREATG